jgi:hypothetical protein
MRRYHSPLDANKQEDGVSDLSNHEAKSKTYATVGDMDI